MFPSAQKDSARTKLKPIKSSEVDPSKEHAEIRFCGGVSSVTGANFLLDIHKKGDQGLLTSKKILIDCGMEQGSAKAKIYNASPFIFDPKDIEMLLVTHAHMDHIGLIPKLVRHGFRGVIYSTPETRDLSVFMLDDALKLVGQEAEEHHTDPLYEAEDLKLAFQLWKTIPYHKDFDLGGGVSVYLKDAGHVLGSSMFEIKVTLNEAVRKFLFTGDLGNSPAPILRDTESIEGVDYVVMESVYGDRNHEDKPERLQKLRMTIEDTIERNGILLVPSFSLEKTQEVLFEINKLFEDGLVKEIPVYLDSPLASKLLPIYKKYTKDYNKEATDRRLKGDDFLNFKMLKIVGSAEESKAIKFAKNPKIIMAGSGMSTGGRIMHHELNYLDDDNTILLFMGFQALGTLGREIRDGAKTVRIYNHDVKIRAEIRTIDGYSGHKDSDHLQEFVETAADTVKKVFVTMGETKSALFLVQRLRDYQGLDAVHPEQGESVIVY
ncbi:MAG: MBL fold metallo-hydrolase [Patescibacteria group bacterium]